jgi:hypothetical protein
VAAVIGALELDDNQTRFPIQSQQVDTSPGVLPLSEFLGDDQ